jgi:seryl-tRNA synthetase
VITELNSLQAQRNKGSDKNSKPTPEQIELLKQTKENIQTLEVKLRDTEGELEDLLWHLPQIPHESTPVGGSEDDFALISVHGDPEGLQKRLGKTPLLFHDLAEKHNLVDLERGVKVHGFRGYYLKNELAILERALLHFAFTKLYRKGFTPMQVPTLTRERYMYGTGYLPFASDNSFRIHQTEEDEGKPPLYLVGSSEVTLVGYYTDELIDVTDPIKMTGNSSCFRSEVGSYGKQAKGIYRVHEFQKVEQVVICENDYTVSDELHQEIINNTHEIWRELDVPYRVIQNSSSDMGLGKYKMFDFEAHSVNADKEWCEVGSASNLGDWQSRRLNIKYTDKSGEKKFVHTLNNTAIATPRCFIPIIENYQNADGSITVPEVLRPLCGFDRIG